MQAKPAFEAMYLHGILHRVEGDMDNAKAWYSDVADSDIFQAVWAAGEAFPGAAAEEHNDQSTPAAQQALTRAQTFLAKVATDGKPATQQSRPLPSDVVETSLRELHKVLSFCEDKFGTDAVTDASEVWVSMSDQNKDIASKMITGGEGWREF
jgi:hypothetical protein